MTPRGVICVLTMLGKCRQLHQIVFRHGLEWLPGLAPGGEPADDHECVEPFLSQQMRHPGAGRLARSSTVEINVFVLGKVLDFFLQIVGLNANGALNALGAPVVIAVAAHIRNLDVDRIPRGQARA